MLRKSVSKEEVVKGYEEIVEKLKGNEIILNETTDKIIILGNFNIKDE